MTVDPYALAGIDLTDFIQPPEWHRDALCKDYKHVNFFPTRGESGAEAKAICGRCMVRAECAAAADERIEFGIWAGTSERERKRLRRAA